MAHPQLVHMQPREWVQGEALCVTIGNNSYKNTCIDDNLNTGEQMRLAGPLCPRNCSGHVTDIPRGLAPLITQQLIGNWG